MYGDSVKDFHVGQRVQLHPVTTAWMSGDRYGEVVKITRLYVHVKRDYSGRTGGFAPIYLKPVTE
jgi:hypothetical protein